MAVDSLIQGGVPTAGPLLTPLGIGNELQNLTLATGQGGIIAALALAPKISSAIVPSVFAAESIAVGLASGGDGTQNNFTKLFGTQTTSQFAATVAAQTGVDATFVTTFINNWLSFYNGVGASAIQAGLTATTQAYAAAFGDAIGNALLAPQTSMLAQRRCLLRFSTHWSTTPKSSLGSLARNTSPVCPCLLKRRISRSRARAPVAQRSFLNLDPDNVGPRPNPPFKTIAGANNFIDAPLIAGQGTLQSADVIDGSAGGVNPIGKFGLPAWFIVRAITQSPLVTNIQEIHSQWGTKGGTLNFANVGQTAGQASLNLRPSPARYSAPDTNTTFSGLKLTTAVAVENYATTGADRDATFKFAGTTGWRPLISRSTRPAYSRISRIRQRGSSQHHDRWDWHVEYARDHKFWC